MRASGRVRQCELHDLYQDRSCDAQVQTVAGEVTGAQAPNSPAALVGGFLLPTSSGVVPKLDGGDSLKDSRRNASFFRLSLTIVDSHLPCTHRNPTPYPGARSRVGFIPF